MNTLKLLFCRWGKIIQKGFSLIVPLRQGWAQGYSPRFMSKRAHPGSLMSSLKHLVPQNSCIPKTHFVLFAGAKHSIGNIYYNIQLSNKATCCAQV